jgi:hypothetical protein
MTVTAHLHKIQAEDHTRELRRRAGASRRRADDSATARSAGRRGATRVQTASAAGEVVIRRATSRDAAGLARLAQLEGRRLESDDLLLAELDGELLAAVPLTVGRALADPFRETAWLVELLETGRAHVRGEDRERTGRLRRLVAPHL